MILVKGRKALSIRQPWAWAVIYGGKDVENRPPGAIKRMEKRFGETIYVHAGKFKNADHHAYASDWMAEWAGIACPSADKLAYGGIIGTAKLVGMSC
jgi:hypothetical protein